MYLLFIFFASQTYVPPPPPKLPAMLSEKAIETGKRLFLKNVYVQGKVETHNYLGITSCASCHDGKTKLNGSSLAKNYSKIREKINAEIINRLGGTELPPTSPAMEALVQYMVHRYKLYDHKLSK